MRALFRADASPAIGGGHIMRCLTLADELAKNGWECVFAVCDQTSGTVPSLNRSQHQVKILRDADLFRAEALAGLMPDGVDLLVVDHYAIGAEYETACRANAGRIFVIDDLANRRHDCDILLDQTFGRVADEYAGLVPHDCQVLVGSEYALLRPQFYRLRDEALLHRSKRRGIRRILISMGMTDPCNLTADILDAIANTDQHVSIDVLLGSFAPHLEMITEKARDISNPVVVHIGVDDVAPILANADLAIGAGGTATWERCCMGLPMIICAFAKNQEDVVRKVSSANAAIMASGTSSELMSQISSAVERVCLDEQILMEMSRAASSICDGEGVFRVVAFLVPEKTKKGGLLTLRKAKSDDAETVFNWQCSPGMRRYFTVGNVPKLDEHLEWFHRKINSLECFLSIIMVDGMAAGMLRLDKISSDTVPVRYEVSILVAPDRQNEGIGTAALKYARRSFPLAILQAKIHNENNPSLSIFANAQFVLEDGMYINRPENELP